MQAAINFQKVLDIEISEGRIRKTELFDLVLLIISLNVFLFLSKPLVGSISVNSELELEVLLEKRKRENVRIILASLRQ